MKRPFVWVFGILLSGFLLGRLFFASKIDANYYLLDSILESQKAATISGTLDNVEAKANSSYLYLKNISVSISSHSAKYHLDNLLVIDTNHISDNYLPGNKLICNGEISKLDTPTNEGQFNEKAYYKGKNIYYKFYASKTKIHSTDISYLKASLYQIRKRVFAVYQKTLSKKDAGIVSAMLLGEKSTLSYDIKELYQKNGISHILAISGLHISIICMILFQILSRIAIPKPLPFIITTCFLILYGIMTGFGISVNRAILMMLIMLFGKEIGRSYDSITAMAFSAFIILLQKPYAIFSCGFLLSYSATLGIVLILPFFKGIAYGSISEQEARIRHNRRQIKECSQKNIISSLKKLLLIGKAKLEHSLLSSSAIWISTFPILLYFYYEIPTYSILLNLLVLPLVSSIVIISFIGGIIGLLSLPLAKLILTAVHFILLFYEYICNIFEQFPYPTQVLGCPARLKILLYYIILCVAFFLLKKPILYSKSLKKSYRLFAVFSIIAGCCLVIYKPSVNKLQITMIDVGQGDGIFIQTETGTNILIDGGSTDIKQVGKYRILPFLKYRGIRKIDYMIMTHADKDHISGQLEFFESKQTMGIKLGEYLIPKPAATCMDDNYRNMVEKAKKAGISTKYIKTGNIICSGKLSLLCLHPDENFISDSTNAYSTTLSLTYGNSTLLLTGDLEANGETALLEKINRSDTCFPKKYDILKVAHHGSKNSSSEEYLKNIRPAISLISCGKNNRYGHPHKELLERLRTINSKIYITAECGAITLYCDGYGWEIRPFLNTADTSP